MSAAQKIKNPLYDETFLKIMIEGTRNTMAVMAHIHVVAGKPFLEPQFSGRGDVFGLINLASPPMRGSLTVQFTTPAILKIYQNMMGVVADQLNPEVRDSVGELTNMIYGSTKTQLNKNGYHLEMNIPRVFQGVMNLAPEKQGMTLVIPFEFLNQYKFHVCSTIP